MSATDPLDIANAPGLPQRAADERRSDGEGTRQPHWGKAAVSYRLDRTECREVAYSDIEMRPPRGGFGITCDRERVQSNWFQIDDRLLRAACHTCGSSSPGMERSWDMGVYALARRF